MQKSTRDVLLTAIIAVVILAVSPAISRAVASFFVADNGYVGIKNSTPQHALDVSGAMYSRLVTATTSDIYWNQGNVQSLTLSSNQTLTFNTAQAGGVYHLILNQDATGNRTVTWPNSIIWPSNSAPTLSITGSSTDIIQFVYDGSHYLGMSSSGGSSSQYTSLLSSLVAYWKLDETTGNAVDEVNSNTLTNNGTVTFSSGRINNAAALSSGKYFSIADANQTGLNITGDMALSFWVKFSSLPTSGGFVTLLSRRSGTSAGWELSLTDVGSGNYDMVFEDENGTPHYSTITTSLSTGTWYHFVLNWTNSSHAFELYKNNSSVGTNTNAVALTGGTLAFTIGASASSPSAQVDEVGIWSRTLTANEVSGLYNSGNGRSHPF
jgi:hypothetical protein